MYITPRVDALQHSVPDAVTQRLGVQPKPAPQLSFRTHNPGDSVHTVQH